MRHPGGSFGTKKDDRDGLELDHSVERAGLELALLERDSVERDSVERDGLELEHIYLDLYLLSPLILSRCLALSECLTLC